MTTRRGFLKAILAAGVAPYVSTAAGVLMPVKRVTTWRGLQGIVADAPAMGAYSGIERATYAYWRSEGIQPGEEVLLQAIEDANAAVLESVWHEATRGEPYIVRLAL